MRAPTTSRPPWDARGLAEIGLAGGIGGDLGANAFELAAANVLEILPLGSRRGRLVKVDGNLEPLPDFRSDVARHGDAVFDGDAIDGDEGHDIGRTHSWMRTLMFGEIEQLRGLPYPADGGFLNGFAFADQRDHATVVVGVHFAIEKKDAGNLHGVDNGIDLRLVTAF